MAYLDFVNAVNADNPVHRWQMNGDLTHDGTGTATVVTNSIDTFEENLTLGEQAAVLDGTSYAEFNLATAQLGSEYTVEMWVKEGSKYLWWAGGTSIGTYLYAYSPGGTNAGKLTFYSGTSIMSTSPVLDDGEWHHVVAVRTSSHTYLYIDGQLDATKSSNNSTAATNRFLIGAGTNASSASAGSVDEVAVYNYAMSAERVAAHYDAAFAVASPVSVSATPATADAEMLDAQFSNVGHVKINAAPMHAEARSGYHEVFGDRAPYTRRMLSPRARRYSGGSSWVEFTGDAIKSQDGLTTFNTVYFQVPSGLLDPTDQVHSFVLRLGATSLSGSWELLVRAATGPAPSTGSHTLLEEYYRTTSGSTHDIPIPVGQEWIAISVRRGDGLYSYATFDSPLSDDTSDLSYFTLSAAPAPVTEVTAPVAHASALAIQPTLDITANILRYVTATSGTAEALTAGVTVQTAADISMQATPATAEGFMPKPTMPNVGVYPDAALGTASMNETWFSSEVKVSVPFAEATGEMTEVSDIASDDNIAIAVGTLTGRGSIREPWLFINDKEVDRNHIDPYWNRVARKSTEGPLPPSANWWFRLNHREGNFAQRLSSAGVFVTNPPQGYINGYNIEGDFEWGAAGPNGKRGLIARDAVFGRSTTGSYDQSTPGHHSVEYTVMVEPGHTGRMEIARGRERHFSGIAGSPDRTFYTGIHDGRVYFGGHSIKRIDDGEWHHVVVTTTQDGNRLYFAIYIDGELDRTLSSPDNTGGTQGFGSMAAPVRFLGGDTDYPFQGEILDIVTRGAVQSHEVKELYLDMFGFKAARAGAPMTASADSYQGHKVISSMKRMLLLSWMPVGSNEADAHRIGRSAWNDKGFYKHSITAANGQLGPMLGYGWDEEMDVGRYLVTVVQPDKIGPYTTALKPEVREQNTSWMFVDKVTGRRRMLDLVNDVDLDQFDVIAFQAYPNKQYEDQHERQMNEAFLESVRTALVMGKKMWITDPYLAADLGLISDVEEVPVLGRVLNGVIWGHDRYGSVGGPDVRGYEVAPFIGLEGGKITKPASGALPVLYPAIPDGSQFGVNDIWGGDVHHNNGYRVVNEIEGLTDIPSWELDEMFWRDRTNMLPQNDKEYYHHGIRMENRTGIDYEWGPDDGSDNFPAKKESTGTGLKVGDEFYDYLNFRNIYELFNRHGTPSQNQRNGRVHSTLAIPPGHLKVGTPVTTFRRTLWNDYGDEIVNPYRDFIRNAVIRPGDRLPDGRKISGYAYMEFAEHPSFGNMAGVSWTKQLTGLPGTGGNAHTPPENEYTFEWDYVSTVRRSFVGRGAVNSVQIKFHYGPRHSNGATAMASKGEVIEWPLPLAPSVSENYATISMPHQTWNSRGISWLTLVDVEEAEVALAHQGDSAQANAGMVSPMVETDFDNEVSVEAAQANGRIVDPNETVLKSTVVTAYAATARGTMTGLQGGYRAEAATAFANMPQNVRRPLDVEEVLFFTVSFTQETIYVRMEEN